MTKAFIKASELVFILVVIFGLSFGIPPIVIILTLYDKFNLYTGY